MVSIFTRIARIFRRTTTTSTPTRAVTISKPKPTSFDIRGFLERGGTKVATTPKEAQEVFSKTQIGKAITRSRGGGGTSSFVSTPTRSTTSTGTTQVSSFPTVPQQPIPKPRVIKHIKKIEPRSRPVRNIAGDDIFNVLQAQKKPKDFEEAISRGLREERRKLRTKQARGKASLLEKIKLDVLTAFQIIGDPILTLSRIRKLPTKLTNEIKTLIKDPKQRKKRIGEIKGIIKLTNKGIIKISSKTTKALKQAIKDPKTTSKDIATSSKKIAKIIKKEAINVGKTIKTSPSEGLIIVGSEILIYKGSGKVFQVVGKLGKNAKNIIKPIIKQRGTTVRFSGTQIQKGDKILTEISFKAGKGKKGLRGLRVGEATGITIGKSKKAITTVVGKIGKLKKGKLIKKTVFATGELTKADKEILNLIREIKQTKFSKLIKSKSEKSLMKATKSLNKAKKLLTKLKNKPSSLRKHQLRIIIKNTELRIKKATSITKKQLESKGQEIIKKAKKDKKKRIKKKKKELKKKIAKSKKDMKRLLKEKQLIEKGKLPRAEKISIKLGIKAKKIRIKKAKKILQKRIKTAKKDITRLTKGKVTLAEKQTIKALKKAKKIALKKVKKISVTERIIGKGKKVLLKKIKASKLLKTRKPLQKVRRKILRASERARRKGIKTLEITKGIQIAKVSTNKIKIIKKNIQSLKQISVGKILQAKNVDKLRRALRQAKVKGVDTKKFASVSNVFTNKDFSLIVGKTLTNKKDLVRFRGIIRGQTSIDTGSLSLKQKRIFKKALEQVLGTASASTVKAKKILPKLSPKAKAIIKKVSPKATVITGTITKKVTAKALPPVSRVTTKAQTKTFTQQIEQIPKINLEGRIKTFTLSRTRGKTVSKARVKTKTRQKQAQKTIQKQKLEQKSKIQQKQRLRQEIRVKIKQRLAQKQRLRQRQKQRLKLKIPIPRPTIAKVPIIPRIKRGIIIPLKKKKKLKKKKGKKGKLGYNVFIKSKRKFIKANKKLLSKKQAKDRGAFFVDKTTANTYKIVPKGISKKLGKLTRGEAGTFNRTRKKFRGFKLKRKRKIGLTNKFIEKKGRPRIDTKGERRGLTVAKLLKRRGIRKRKKKKGGKK